ncbi:heme uptake protein IsdC [Staphylococcus argenteus]|uniref:Iron-regulated surface determinant protein C n=1 Tax=Staphylococcus argenteus TaxID=985002 RepID=A0A7U7PYA6_9STAP|nr:heme uptake protein IsdC [Staphylococcus argenteus]BBN29986.1 iron (Fe2+)-regulated surface determinant protein IsdC [Staphylococcus aureus]API79133.1 heme uptake protein IsdC [Staphylococcus argenteus]ATY56721.1 heme uptake protein IsdC [Staphylococcus argenteus]ATZ86943.1 heme uptake protein IsdC [Staphylococcus argenteus]EKF1503455.1 heme uptake protein IsdC [Staphylococcus argenteus]
MKNIVKVFNTTILALIIIIATFGNTANAAESGTLDYEVYKYNTNDTSIANDYFNKPAKYVKKNGKLYVQITVNHSHWITGMSIEGHKENIINKDTAKDERTSEFEVSKLNGKIDGKIDVYINEKVNGKPFKYDHHYNITYKFNGPTDVASAGATSNDDKTSASGSDKGTEGATSGQSGSESSDKNKVENPQTNAGTPAYIYAIPVASLALLIAITLFVRKRAKGNVK